MQSFRPSGPNRRDFLRVSGLTAAGVMAGSSLLTPSAHAATVDYTARRTFDDWDRLFQQGSPGQPDQPNDNTNADGRSGMLAWSQSYVLLGLVRMYETYKAPYYLDRLIENIDQVLSVRDSERGVTDYRGRSEPAWRADHPYTVGFTTLKDADGRPTLEVRSGLSYADTTTVSVQAGSRAGTFTLKLVNTQTNRTETAANLTMDPSSPDYAVTRVYQAPIGPLMVTVRDVRESPAAAGDPVTGSFPLLSAPVIFAVHTGMITYPIASFVRIVRQSPPLLANPRYRAKAAEYLAAVRDAVAVHDWEYRETDGEGCLIWPKSQPLPYDGCEQPLNQSVGLGQTLVELAIVTGDPTYRRKVAAMAKMLSRQLAVDAGGAYSWHYWPAGGHVYDGFAKTGSPATDVSVFTPEGRGAKQFEDISHGAIDVEFAVRAFRAKLGFTGQDMVRLARTYTQNVAMTDAAGLPSIHTTVAGTGTGAASVAHQAPRWMQVAPWSPEVHRHSLALYDRYRPTPEVDGQQAIGFGWLLGNVAYLNWGAKFGA
ncbi:secreted protein [Kribbella amoyensis]|uniref:Secreted protein n=1 Tax=Kribbella amoyensis TaxID=996641 RepID=A0A561B989_9ACTN|nr:twin-arginine translocation signal domain-containing protein [Kribbella amoyensis]TWD75337.1 secreted protein [Kribbella amoyensis]